MSPQETAIQTITPPKPVPPTAPPRRRWRRFALRAGICLLILLATPVVGYFVVDWYVQTRSQAVLDEMDRVDPHWRFDDLIADRKPIPDEKNPALVAMKVDSLMRPAGGFDLGRKHDQTFEDLPPQRRLNGVQIEALRQALDKHPDALKLARTLKDYPDEGRYPVKRTSNFLNTNLDVLQRSRNVAWLLESDAKLRAENQDIDGAVESCRACLTLSRAVGDEPYLIATLIRIAEAHIAIQALERALAQGRASEEELKAMQESIRRDIGRPILLEAVRGERAGFDAFVGEIGKGNVKVSAIMGPGMGRSSWESWLLDNFPVILTSGRPEYLRLMNKTVEAAQLPPEQQGAAMDAIEKEVRNTSTPLVRLLMPAISKVGEAYRRHEATLRCALCAVAAERYRLRHGDWPASLQELADKGWIDAVPIDPFDGQPLRYKRTVGEGVIIYSVSFDGVDDGGVIDRARWREPGRDWGFQLWDDARRRQTPLPPKLIED